MTEMALVSLENWFDQRVLDRGRQYVEEGRLLRPARRGDVLRARCLGTDPQPYDVEAILGPEGLRAARCTCPVGATGHCKHVAALALAWRDDPEAFAERPTVGELLGAHTRDDLVDLVERMVRRHPDLETLLELPAGLRSTGRAAEVGVVRRAVDEAFERHAREGWRASYAIARDLGDLMELARRYTARRRRAHAATVYAGIADEVLAGYGRVVDEDDELAGLVTAAVGGLGLSLRESSEPRERERILTSLLDVYRRNLALSLPGLERLVREIVLTAGDPDERRRTAGSLERLLETDAAAAPALRRRVQRTRAHFLEGVLDDAAFLPLAREAEAWHPLVRRLLALGRVEEAAEAASEAPATILLDLADLFVGAGAEEVGVGLVRDRATRGDGSRLREWLIRRAERRGDWAEALRWAEEVLWERLDLTDYVRVRDLARHVGRWGWMRPLVLRRMAERGHYRLLTEVYLAEGEVDRALETVEAIPPTAAEPWAMLRLDVARAAEQGRPRDAIRLYMQRVDELTEARGRDHYGQAADYLARVRDIYRRLDDDVGWRELIRTVRELNRRLPAFQDELKIAGL